MTTLEAVAIRSRVGRKMMFPERTAIKCAAGTWDRIFAVLEGEETRMAFMQAAIERELVRREKRAEKLRRTGKSK